MDTTAARTNPVASTSSTKPTLTIALQRAQTAVLLDAANDVPAAIQAYVESVSLLNEVMNKVREGSARDRELAKKLRAGTSQGEENVTDKRQDAASKAADDETLRRCQRAERKSKAKEEEGRRLKVIVCSFPFALSFSLSVSASSDTD